MEALASPLSSPLSSLSSFGTSPPPELPVSPSQETSPAERKKRRSPRSWDEKIERFHEILRDDLYCSFEELLTALLAQSGLRASKRKAAIARAVYLNPNILHTFLGYQTIGPRIKDALLTALDGSTGSIMRGEVKNLSDKAPFGKYPMEDTGFQIEALDKAMLQQVITQWAPETMKILQRIMEPTRGDFARTNEYIPRIALIMAILCQSQRRYSATNFQTLFGLYLRSKGVGRRQIDMLAQFGVTVSYGTIRKVVKTLADRRQDSIAITASTPDVITADPMVVEEGG
jgi:hypothetical protein